MQYTYSTPGNGTNASRLTGIIYPDGYTLNYNYASGVDANISRLSNLTDFTGVLESYTYMGLATVVARNHPQPGLNLSYLGNGTGDAGDAVTGLDRFGRVVDQNWTVGNTSVSNYTYGYDTNSNVLFKQDNVNGNFSQLYTYDNLNQLTSYKEGTLNANHTAISGNATANQSWTYDALGNWDVVTTGNTTQDRTANAQNEYTGVGNATLAYNLDGDMTTDQNGNTLVYDAWNRLVKVIGAGNVTLETNSYDPIGERISTTANSITTNLLYSADWQVLEEKVGANYTNRYVWSPVYVDAIVLRDSAGNGTSLTANGTPGTRLWAVEDANWDVAALVNGNGTVAERYDYTPFGVVTIYSPTYSVRGTSLYSWTQGFQGMFLDKATGLDGSRGREGYSPTLGQWIQSDPIGFESGDLNWYRFVGNDPENGEDPSGLTEIAPMPREVSPNQIRRPQIDLSKGTIEEENVKLEAGGSGTAYTLEVKGSNGNTFTIKYFKSYAPYALEYHYFCHGLTFVGGGPLSFSPEGRSVPAIIAEYYKDIPDDSKVKAGDVLVATKLGKVVHSAIIVTPVYDSNGRFDPFLTKVRTKNGSNPEETTTISRLREEKEYEGSRWTIHTLK